MRKAKEKPKRRGNSIQRDFDVPLSRDECIRRLENLFNKRYFDKRRYIEFYKVDHKTYEFWVSGDAEVYGQLINEDQLSTRVTYNITFNGFNIGCISLVLICFTFAAFSPMIQGDRTPLLCVMPLYLFSLYQTIRARENIAQKIQRTLLESKK